MKIITRFIAIFLTVGLLALPARMAEAVKHDYAPGMCTSTNAADDLRLNGTMAYMGSGGLKSIRCPAAAGEDTTTVDASAAYIDTWDGLNVPTGDVSCAWTAVTSGGSAYYSVTLYSCGTAGGCILSARDASWAGGNGYLGWANPLNSGSSLSYLYNFDISCTVYSSASIGIRHYQVDF